MQTSYFPFRSLPTQHQYLSHYDATVAKWPVPYEEQFINTSYGKTHVRISGPVDAPALVLLHGAGTCALQWLGNIAALSAHYRTYAIDGLINIGCLGKSIPAQHQHISNDSDAVQWIDECFDDLALSDDTVLLGASHGGWLASRYALQRPQRIEKLILIAPAGFVLPFSKAYFARSILLALLPIKSVYQSFFKWSLKHLAQQQPALLDMIIDDFRLSASCFEKINPKTLPNLDVLSDETLANFTVPTQFIIGEDDVLYDAQRATERLNRLSSTIKTVMIPNAGHDVLLVEPDSVHQHILDFLGH